LPPRGGPHHFRETTLSIDFALRRRRSAVTRARESMRSLVRIEITAAAYAALAAGANRSLLARIMHERLASIA
jgi:hypothetical protein